MSDYVNIHAMDEAIEEFKKEKREAMELKLLDMFSQLVTEYKKYNSKGEYLNLTYVDGTLSVVNSYNEDDSELPINALILGAGFDEDVGKFRSLNINGQGGIFNE